MRDRLGRRLVPWLPIGIALLLGGPMTALAQPAPDQSPFPQPTQGPPLPGPANPPTAGASAGAAHYEERIRQLEAQVQALVSAQSRTAGGSTAPSRAAGVTTNAGTEPTTSRDSGSAASNATPSASGGPAAPGQSFPPNPPPSPRFDTPATLASVKANVKFGPGFEFRTNDDEFFLQFHNLTQFDYRGYEQGNQNPVKDTFAIPRQWFMFSGRITKPIGYFVSLQNGLDTVSALDVFVDLNYDPRLQFRIGRFKTPFTYEFLVEPIQGLILPERSVFFNNFGQNRDTGVMAYGRLLEGYVDYAVGIFNGTRNGFLDTNNSKDYSAFVNFKPFKDAEGSVLENFNVGGSVFGGNELNTPVPQTLRTAIATSGNQTIGVPFLTFNNNVRESGNRMLWDLHSALFYRQLAVIGEWGSGFQNYALSNNLGSRTRLPIDSFYVQAGYLLTGETRSGTGIVKPLSPFDIRKGKFGLGAWELTGRYQHLDIGSQVFTNGLADANNWANRVNIADLGVNWHMTQYLKFLFNWEHSMFNQPVLYNSGARQLTSDLFLFRFQLYF